MTCVTLKATVLSESASHKHHVLWDHIYVSGPEMGNPETRSRLAVARGRGEGGPGWGAGWGANGLMGTGFLWGMMKMDQHEVLLMVAKLNMLQTVELYTLRYVSYYLNKTF